MKPLLILRPEDAGLRTADRARVLGLEPICIPLFKLRSLRWTLPDVTTFDAVVVTSANAIHFGGPQLAHLLNLPFMAVGKASAAAASAAGFSVAVTGDGDNQAVFHQAHQKGYTRLLHLCGRDVVEGAAFSGAITRIPVYAAETIENPVGLSSALRSPHAVLLFSSRAARRFADLCAASRANIDVVAISQIVAQAAGQGWSSVQFATQPAESEMLELARKMCD